MVSLGHLSKGLGVVVWWGSTLSWGADRCWAAWLHTCSRSGSSDWEVGAQDGAALQISWLRAGIMCCQRLHRASPPPPVKAIGLQPLCGRARCKRLCVLPRYVQAPCVFLAWLSELMVAHCVAAPSAMMTSWPCCTMHHAPWPRR